jgi:NAD(P)-dependent dehydrogenase (short-subunit alcohol dehydrogenase family)
MFRLNTLGALRVAQGVLRRMRERDTGHLVFISRVAGRKMLPLGGAYAQSKRALEALAETLALELAQTGVHVTLVGPAAIAGIGRSKAPVFRDGIQTYAPFSEGVSTMQGDDGMPTEVIAGVVADIIESDDPPLRSGVDESIEGLLRALDASDRFKQPFDLNALQS